MCDALDFRGPMHTTLKESACVLPGPKGLGNPLDLFHDRDSNARGRRTDPPGPGLAVTPGMEAQQVTLGQFMGMMNKMVGRLAQREDPPPGKEPGDLSEMSRENLRKC